MNQADKIEIAKTKINEYFGVDICVKSRKREVIMARQFFYKWVRDNTNLGYTDIGRLLSLKQDHSTVIHSLERFDEFMDQYGSFDVHWDDVNINIDKAFEIRRLEELVFNPS